MNVIIGWTGRDLNPKPLPCKGSVIPDLTTSPRKKIHGSFHKLHENHMIIIYSTNTYWYYGMSYVGTCKIKMKLFIIVGLLYVY